MKKRVSIWTAAAVIAMACLTIGVVNANAPSIAGLQHPQLVGEGRLKVAFWKVYDVALYSENGEYDASARFALDINYLRKVSATSIVDKTMEEIRRMNPDVADETTGSWEEQLLAIFPDVRKGTNITGVKTDEGFTEFYSSGTSLGAIEDKSFTEDFFAIWLGENTARPALRKKLLGIDDV